MSNVCYSLETAAEKLKFSETVLVRLSQYLKVPQTAYETVGYLSFKGDLEFSEDDINYFSQVKERLLSGESLDEVKTSLQPKHQTVLSTEAQATPTLPVVSPEPVAVEPVILGGDASTSLGELPPMREIQDRKPYEKAAEKSFERYKSMHRSHIGKVFENLLKEVGSAASGAPKRKQNAKPQQPTASKIQAPAGNEQAMPLPGRNAAGLPFSHWTEADASSKTGLGRVTANNVYQSKSANVNRQAAGVAVWEPMIQQAAQKPRGLNGELKNVAMELRARALGETQQ